MDLLLGGFGLLVPLSWVRGADRLFALRAKYIPNIQRSSVRNGSFVSDDDACEKVILNIFLTM